MLHHFECWIESLELLLGRIEFLAADIGGRVDDLALQIAGVDNIEINKTESAHTGRCQVQGERRTKPTRAHAKHACGLQFALAFYADLRQNQVARVAREVVRSQFGQSNR